MRSSLATALVGLLLVAGGLAPSTASAAAGATAEGETYYIDASAGDDQADGLSPSRAWKSLDKVNATTFEPGDSILFRSGETWTGQLHPKGSGSAEAVITIGKYGGEERPTIEARGLFESAVHLYNQQHWDIGHLEVTNDDGKTATSPRRGVHVGAEDFGDAPAGDLESVATLRGISIHDLYVHDVSGQDLKDGSGSAGIQVSVHIPGIDADRNPVPGSVHRRTTFDQVLIENNVVETVSRSGIVTWSDWLSRAELGEGIGYGSASTTPFTPLTNVVIRGNQLRNIGGDGIVPHMTVGALVEHNVIEGFNKTSTGYNVGMWTWDGDDTVYQFNEVSGGYSTRDGNAFDFDHGSRGIVYQYNYSHDNDGGALLFCADGRAGGVWDGVFRYNVSQNDRYKLFTICGGSNLYNMQVYNNVFYVGPGMSTTIFDAQGGANQVSFANNIFYNLGAGGYAAKPSWTYDHNTFFGNNVPTFAVIPDAAMSTANPLLLAPGTATAIDSLDGYRLSQDSPSLGAGVPIPGNSGEDRWGNSIPAGEAPNRGAYSGQGLAESMNLLRNPGLEFGAQGWALWNGTIQDGAGRAETAAAALEVGEGSFEQTVAGLTPNTTYTFSGFGRVDGTVVRIGVKNYSGEAASFEAATPDYSEMSVTFTTGPQDTSATLYFWKPTVDGSAYGDDFALIRVPDSDPVLTLGSESVRAGETVDAQLSGFVPGSAVSFWLDDVKLTDAVVDAEGALTSQLSVPVNAAAGEHDVVVKDASGEELASAALTVEPAEPVKDPSVTASLGSVRVGSALSVQLRGFEPDAAVQMWLHSEPVKLGDATIGDDGAAVVTVTIPVGTEAGQHSLVATDADGVELARTDLAVTAVPVGGGGDAGSDGSLPMTGADGARWLTVGLSALVLMALGGVLWTRRRRRDAMSPSASEELASES